MTGLSAEIEDALRELDPRETIKIEGRQVYGYDTCNCQTELKTEARIWREENLDWFDWIGMTIGSDHAAELTVRDLKTWIIGRVEPLEWMPPIPSEWAHLPDRLDAWVGRALAWQYPELYDKIPRKRSECWGCGFGKWSADADTWDAIFARVRDGVPLRDAQLDVAQVEPGMAHTFRLMYEKGKRDSNEYARQKRAPGVCSFCHRTGYVGKVQHGELAIEFDHGIPKARWDEFFGRHWSESQDREHHDNLAYLCKPCNANKGKQTMSEFLQQAGANFDDLHPDLERVVAYEAEVKQKAEVRRARQLIREEEAA